MSQYEKITLILQTAVAVAAFATLAVYYHQLLAMSKQVKAAQDSSAAQSALYLVNFLQSQEVRAARECVRSVLSKKELSEWSEEERRCASLVCSNYDVVAGLLKAQLAPLELISKNWTPSIRHCHEVLQPFVDEIRAKPGADPSYWSNFDWLCQKVSSQSAA
jgi:hypothetical protein